MCARFDIRLYSAIIAITKKIAMTITFDLDSVIFDINPLMAKAFDGSGQSYFYPTNWDMYKCYSFPIVNKMLELFADDELYNAPLIDKKIPQMLNSLMRRPNTDVLFVTQRVLKQPIKTFQQLTNAGIHCNFSQIYDRHGAKSDILRDIKTDLHFDDSPIVVSGCIEKHVPIVMISNETTPYNYHLRGLVKHYENLRTAMIDMGLCDALNVPIK